MTTRYALDRARYGANVRFNSGGRPVRDAAEFKESDHPRAENGQFGSGGGGASKTEKPAKKSEAGAAQPAAQKTETATAAATAAKPSLSSTPGPGASSNSAPSYKAPTKTADQIIAAIPGAKEAVDNVRKKINAGASTNSLVSEGGHMLPNGKYTPERQKVHKEIIRKQFSKENIEKYTPKDGEKATLTVLGGRGGSGKSWFTKPGGIIDTNKHMTLDSDSIKEALPEYQGWNAALLHEEASHVLKIMDRIAAKKGMNVVLDGTLKSIDSIESRIAEYKKNEGAGYEMVGRYMHTNPETAAERAFGRWSKGGTFSGRFVPPEVILGNTKNEQNFDKLSSHFKEWSVYDNNGDKPKLMSESKGK